MLYTNATIITIMLLEWLSVEHLKAASRISRAGSWGWGGGGGGVKHGEQSHVFLISQDRWQHHLVGH